MKMSSGQPRLKWLVTDMLDLQAAATVLPQCENCEKITGGLANMGRGAAGAEGDGVWGGVGLWRGLCPLHRKICNFLSQNSAFWRLF